MAHTSPDRRRASSTRLRSTTTIAQGPRREVVGGKGGDHAGA